MNPVPTFESGRAALDPNILLYRDRLECSLALPALHAERRRNRSRAISGAVAVGTTAAIAAFATYAASLLRW